MKRIARLHVLLAALAFAPVATAAPPDDAQIDRLMTVMRVEQTVVAMLPQVRASQKQMIDQLTADKQLSLEQRRQMDVVLERSNDLIVRALAWERLQPVYRDIYRQTFTAEDVDAMLGFYGSPSGQNVLDKMPQLMKSSMTAVQALLVPVFKEMQADIEAEAAQTSTRTDG